MKLIIGLGNPGKQYENTRHNAGFMAIDYLARRYKVEFKLETKFKAMVAVVNDQGNKAILIKPQTYMNLSGDSVNLVMKFYKVDINDIIVLSDDLDSPVGRIRLREHGSAGGHNGLKSISTVLASEDFKRMKFGIDRSDIIPVVDWVLSKFSSDERITMEQSFAKASDALVDFIQEVSFKKISSLYSSK